MSTAANLAHTASAASSVRGPATPVATEGAASAPDVDVAALMADMGRRAVVARRELALASAETRTAALVAAADAIRRASPDILAANADDIAEARANGQTEAYIDRLALDGARIDAIADGVAAIAALPDPVGKVLATFERPNGLIIQRVSTPLGVIGIIFESRPNVTADAAALSLKAGNAVILRSGSDSFRSASAIARAMSEGLAVAGVPADAVQLVPTRDRAAVGEMLRGLNGAVDVIVPRGGKSLVERVQNEARVPVFAHLEGLVHVYVDAEADLETARAVVLNSKMRRTSICGAAETLLIDRAGAGRLLAPLVSMLLDAGCEVRGDADIRAVDARVTDVSDADWGAEYLEAIISARLVDGLDGALAHINAWSSQHTDCIITENVGKAERFLNEVDSAIVLHNASTQFADGGEFGFGGEIGIATGRMHARGPVGAEQLTSFKYKVRGAGQTRP
ncbi:glutamate-5-semialdehyde dehydrogenase [Camelimonas lactis]|uniref:Gamma-glutamyl phosphate reductase n=2 Tax=Camelimonas lactis TaxID=659006 RepID=A0A4R2GM32_9HYPH|nr:glutamate-5-semialdehyde dehydrogenase [Camelimonas lactis]